MRKYFFEQNKKSRKNKEIYYIFKKIQTRKKEINGEKKIIKRKKHNKI